MRISAAGLVGGPIVGAIVLIATAQGGDWPLGWKAQPGTPNTLIQIARSIDDLEDKILDDGVVVVKQPDVWGQSRMTLYRKDFETMMKAKGPDDFQAVLSARIARLDAAALQSQTSLSASLASAPQGGGGLGRRGGAGRTAPAGGSASAVTSPTVVALQNPAGGGQGQAQTKRQGDGGGEGNGGGGAPENQFWNIQPLPTDAPYALLSNKQPFSDMDPRYGGKLGLDPPVFLDEKKRFFDHLNQIRRVNIGDDNADSAGYGLYLVRMPISIQPGECTLKGHGAILTVTARHEFNSNNFLKDTFRYLVINDLVDQLGPIVFELIRGGLLQVIEQDTAQLKTNQERYFYQRAAAAQKAEDLRRLKASLDVEKQANDQARQISGLPNRISDVILRAITTDLAQFEDLDKLTSELVKNQLGAKLFYERGERAPTNLKAAIRSDVLSAITEAVGGTPGAVNEPGSPGPVEQTSAATIIDSLRLKVDAVRDELQAFPPGDNPVSESFRNFDRDLSGMIARLNELYVKNPKPGDAPKLDVKRLVGDLKAVIAGADQIERGKLVGAGLEPLYDRLEQAIKQIEEKRPDEKPIQPRDLKTELSDKALEYYRSATEKIGGIVDGFKKISADATPQKQQAWLGFFTDLAGPIQLSVNQMLRDKPQGVSEKDIPDLAARLRTTLRGYEAFLRAILGSYPPEELERLGSELTELNRRSAEIEKGQLEALEGLARAGTPSEMAAQAAEIGKMQSALQIERVASLAFPSTRFGGRSYPVAPSDIDDVFLKEGIFTLVRKTQESLQTETPRATDVRNYLRHELEAAYELLNFYEDDIEEITRAIQNERDYARLGRELYPMLVAKLPGDLKRQPDDPVAILCWCVAVESGLLNRHLQKDICETQVARGTNIADSTYVSTLRFYQKVPAPEAEETFEHYVQARWPMIVFALDPFVDEQNLADAMSLRRDLQLAMAFAFSTGKINFNQLIQYNRKIEQDAETIALNRTVTSFSYGTDTFGWRFYPRYQNPPPERSNLQTITNMLWRGGPPRNYQMNNSKLEPGERELTAVIIMPSFLQRVRFDITGNWFPLHDPDQIKVHTARMLEQGRKVVELKQSLATAEECAQYRAEDLERLQTRVNQLEAMLAMQTRRVNVPYENSLGGFELFTQGTTALVPEVTGFEGVDSIEQDKPADILIFGRHFSLHETKVVVGGKVLVPDETNPSNFMTLGNTQVEIVSREVIHLKLPSGVRPSKIRSVADRDLARTNPQLAAKLYVELYLATPNGISNRLLIPFAPKAPAPATTAEPSVPAAHVPIEFNREYVVLDDTFKIQGALLPGTASDGEATSGAAGGKAAAGGAAAGAAAEKAAAKTTAPRPAAARRVKPLEYHTWDKIRIMPTKPPAKETDTIDVEFHFPIDGGVSISVRLAKLAYREGAYVITHEQLTKLADDFLMQLDSFGKLVGDKRASQSTSSEIFISSTGSSLPPATTYNSLHVEVVLFTSLSDEVPTPSAAGAAATEAEAKAVAATGAGAAAPAAVGAGSTPAPGQTSPSGSSAPAAPPGSTKGSTPKIEAEKRGTTSIDRLRRSPAAGAADPAVVKARQAAGSSPTTMSERPSRSWLPPPSSPLVTKSVAAARPAATANPAQPARSEPNAARPAEPKRSQRRSLLSRLTGRE
jgi:hypothetical protein